MIQLATGEQQANFRSLKLYTSLRTILGHTALFQPRGLGGPELFSACEKQGIYTFDGLKVEVPFIQNLITPADEWKGSNHNQNHYSNSALTEITTPLLHRIQLKWGQYLTSCEVGFREKAPFSVAVNGVSYSFRCDATLIGLGYNNGNGDRLAVVLLQEKNGVHPRRGLCQIQRMVAGVPTLEACVAVYPGYVQNLVFGLRDKTYFSDLGQLPK